MNVLITSANNFNAIALIRELATINEVHIYISDEYPKTTARFLSHSFIHLPGAREANYKTALTEACEKHKIDVIIPSSEDDFIVLAELKSTGKFKIAISDLSLIEKLIYHDDFEDFMTENNFARNSQSTMDEIFASGLPNLRHYLAEFAIDFAGNESEISLRKIVTIEESIITVSEIVTNEKLHKKIADFIQVLKKNGGCGIFHIHLIEHKDDFLINSVHNHINATTGPSNVIANKFCRQLLFGKNVATQAEKVRPTRSFTYLKERSLPTVIPNLKAVIFDLDETIFPQKPWILAKLGMLHDELKIEKVSKEKLIDTGLRLLEEGHRSDLLDRLSEICHLPAYDMIQKYRTIIPNTMEYPDVKPVLSELKAQGYLIGLLTDNPPNSQKQKLQSTGLEGFFDAIVFTKESGFEKPDPQGFNKIRAKLNVEANECCMVGDHLYKDIIGGHRSGFAALCWLQRSGGLFNFDENLFRKLNPEVNFHRFADMTHLKGFLDRK